MISNCLDIIIGPLLSLWGTEASPCPTKTPLHVEDVIFYTSWTSEISTSVFLVTWNILVYIEIVYKVSEKYYYYFIKIPTIIPTNYIILNDCHKRSINKNIHPVMFEIRNRSK